MRLLPLSLYIHWPFCKAKCPYCDFNSHVRERVDHAAWRRALLAELDHMAGWLASGRAEYGASEKMKEFGDEKREVTSIFFGGGTPSLMPPSIVEALLRRAQEHFTFAPEIEITLEANPTSAEAENFAALREAGVNRVSLGVQSLKSDSLKFLGRRHSVREALDAVALAAKIFPRTSFDLIYALPGQSVGAWEKELREALKHADRHLSLYQLTIEPNTAFHHLHETGKLTVPGDGLSADLFEATQAIMEAHGLPMYEVSNHAKPGEESRHNLCYWTGGDWLGIGPGAHGRVTIPSPAGGGLGWGHRLLRQCHTRPPPDLPPVGGGIRVATETVGSPERWLAQVQTQGHGLSLKTAVEPRAHIEELVMMGLRLKEGISLERFAVHTGMALQDAVSRTALNRLIGDALLESTSSSLSATGKGVLVLNSLTAELLTVR